MSNNEKKEHTYTDAEKKHMMETYGRILTPEEWRERKSRFVSGPEDVLVDDKGNLIL